ncbi:MAG: SGNH/GDSL hydrolase family protein [Maribacter dokdonensis]|uniref:SGNH/GDSL hydrolase family protein n=1 Tax=Maribacter TaxID=252356 RepID=UPI00071999C8|nr:MULTISPECIES: SGNH/GDSL hydrolase family protein [Maribacter]KSA14579.1 Acetylesterase, lipase-GDSL family [Maribacter dokdonensis DSW-8]MDP2526960.1 SGNH/GDSL hydrolase family protein [Maribacter dokdonensis]HAF79175.1 G-D-S-L family lipolytic protein [Maribacter sp.]|tara:strand:+ start:35160 stop:35849 length:690 start_codon:yes stop_codon:yes gene_type:complete
MSQQQLNLKTIKKIRTLTVLIFFVSLTSFGQVENVFTKEVKDITAKYDSIWDSSKETIVFTGSSSVRLWRKLQEEFPDHQIINSGFGGSQASDLLYFIDELILSYNPKKVFIYEGDNDLWAKKRPADVLDTTADIIRRIKAKNTSTQVILISAKPSISRWKIRGKYKRLNRKMERFTQDDPNLFYVDVWKPMLNKRKLKTDIFIEDGLHMNQKGYDIWYAAMKDLVNQP